MKQSIAVLLKIVMILFLLQSCSSKPVVPVKWTYAPGGIELRIKADDHLNEENGKAYTLYMVIYQLSDPDKFNLLGEDEQGLEVLLESKVFDPTVKSVKSVIIYPNSDVTYTIDRSQHAEYVGIVAGYNVLSKDRIQRVYRIGQKQVKLNKRKRMVPEKLFINLYLSPTQIEEI